MPTYPTVDFATLLRKACGKAGIPYAQIQADDFDLFTGYFDDRLKECWEIHRWPELCPIEQRTFAQPWNSTDSINAQEIRFEILSQCYFISLVGANVNNPPTLAGMPPGTDGSIDYAHWQLASPYYSGEDWQAATAYTAGTIVRNPPDNQYYSCYAAGTSGNGSGVDLTMFSLLLPLDRVIAKAQSWPALNAPAGTTGAATVIGEFMFPAYDRDPRQTTKVRTYPFELTADGAQFTRVPMSGPAPYPNAPWGFTPPFVWLLFRVPRPELSGSAFNAATAYAAGQGMYYGSATTTPGDFYVTPAGTNAGDTPDSAPNEWTLQALPKFLELALIRGAYADWLRADGQLTAAVGAEGDMETALELEADKLQRQGGQVRRLQML